MTDLSAKLRQAERDLGGTLGVYAVPLNFGASKPMTYHHLEGFPAASTIKVYILLTLLQQVQEGHMSLEDEVLLTEADQVTGSGVLKALTAGRFYTLSDLATLMIIVSDNTATNLLIERLGLDAINATCERHGWHRTRLAGKLQQASNTSMSVTSPRDLGDYFVRLWRGELLDEQFTSQAKDIFFKQQYTDQLGRDLGFDAYSAETGESPLRIASKSGSIRGVRNDVGVISDAQREYVISVMTKDCQDRRFHVNNLGSVTIARVSRVLYEHFTRIPSS